MGTIIVSAIVAGAAVLAVRSIIKDKKAGRSIQCGGDCTRCGGGCH
ncbi:MAG: FeoB-associated Cys-rich membrane protein [Lachnospiraceae bacterium]|nr:FeoB-associated Cys-rich membrane protein [Lachnospiraceae bacterium]